MQVASRHLPPLVFLPGMQCSPLYFRAVIESLEAAFPGLRPLAFHLDGRDLAEAVDGVLALVREPAVLVGHSLGGTVAMAASRTSPEAVAGLAAICSNPRAPSEEQRAYWRAAAELARSRGAAEVLERALPGLLGSREPSEPDAQAAGLCREMAEQVGAGLLAQLDLQQSRVDERPALRSFRGPVLAIAAEDDRVVPGSWVRELAESAPLGEFASIPGAPHMAPLTHPRELAALLQGWLMRNFQGTARAEAQSTRRSEER